VNHLRIFWLLVSAHSIHATVRALITHRYSQSVAPAIVYRVYAGHAIWA
jgi:hypothetical protein